MSNESYTSVAGCDSAGSTVSTEVDALQYACPHCDAMYDTELFARVHITRADDPNHRTSNGMVAECEIPVVDAEGTIVERRSRQPDEIDLTTLKRSDFPDSLTDKRRTALLVGSQYPNETNREQLTALIKEWTADTEWDAPSSWTVGRALNSFYHPHKSSTDSDTAGTASSKTSSLTELEPLQQAIIICRVAKPELSQAAIGRQLDCAESYPGQVLNSYQDILESLTTQSEETSLAAALSNKLTPATQEMLTASTPIETILGEEIIADETAAASGESAEGDTSPAPTQITSQWGSPVDDSKPLSAVPTLSTDSSDDTTDTLESPSATTETTETAETEEEAEMRHSTTDANVSEHSQKADRDTTGSPPSALTPAQAGTAVGDNPVATDLTAHLKELKTRVSVVEDLVSPTDTSSLEAQMLVNLANIVETSCDELIEAVE